jgi:3-dehydroquinate synthase
VAAGMVFAAALSVRVRGFPSEDAARLEALLARFGLPVAPRRAADGVADWTALRRAMTLDKKARDGIARFVLAEGVGRVVLNCAVGPEVLESVYRAWSGKEGADGGSE